MIRKIKKYKITVRPFGVLRHLKKQIKIESAQEPQDSDLESMICKVQPHITPCALYTSFSKTEIPPALETLWKSSPPKSLSLSVIAATLGKPIEQEIERVSRENDSFQGALWNSVARESLEQSFNFIEKLIEEEAREDSCVLSPLLPASSQEINPIFKSLESHKAEMMLNDSGQVVPLFTGVRYCFWIPAKGLKPKK